jgi:hypothetical protein
MFSERMGFGALRRLGALVLLLTAAGFVATAGGHAATSKFIPSQQPEVPSCDPFGAFDSGEFPTRPTHDNKWVPLVPGTQFVLEGRANRGGGALPHTVVFTVTDLTKVIDGVRTRVLWDVDSNQGVVQEAELAFFAEDEHANIWLMGEYPENWELGVFKGAPLTWLSGTLGSQAGVQVPARPRLSGPSYIQGLAPEVGFFDCGKDIKTGQYTCVPIGCFDHVYVTEEWNPNDPTGGFQIKYYAPWVGNISIGAVNDPEGETLVLTQINHLDKAGIQHARAEALKLDERAYLISDAYRATDPAQPGGKRPVIPAPVPPTRPPAPPTAPQPVSAFGPQKSVAPAVKPKHRKARRNRCGSKRQKGSKRGHGSPKQKRCGSKRLRQPPKVAPNK